MKKSLIALAALGAFAGAASAQSSVTLYGLIDLNYQNVKAGDLSTGPAGETINRLSDGHDFGPGSRWGLRVAEDLGSGLKANVVLESGFNGDNGTSNQGGRLFGRQAFVSLASNVAGEVRLGRQYALHDEVQLLNNPFGNATYLNPGAFFSTAGTLANASSSAAGSSAATRGSLPLFIDAPRIDNAVQYITPSFAGFRVQAMVAAGEGTAGRYQGLKGTYAQGPLNVALSYEDVRKIPGVVGTHNKVAEIAANYDFGMVKIMAGYQDGRDLVAGAVGQVHPGTFAIPGVAGAVATDLKAYTVGAAVPFGAATVGINYTRTKYDFVGGDRTLGRIGLGANYALSKLTSVYVAGGVANGDLKENVLEKRLVQVGLRKAF